MEQDQEYWSVQVADYEVAANVGPEVQSMITGASKIFWEKEMSDERLEKTLDVSKHPSNCGFLTVQQVNKEIWGATSGEIRAKDFNLQKIQETHAAMSSNLIQAISTLSGNKEQLRHAQPIIEKLNVALKLAGKTSQQLNAHRRESFKPSLPTDLKKLVEKPGTESTWLFGENLKERMAMVRGDNTVREAFEKKEYRYPAKSADKGSATKLSWGGGGSERSEGAYTRGVWVGAL